MGAILTVQTAIERVFNQVQDFKAVYSYPTFDIGRLLPVLTIVYDGYAQKPGAHSGEQEGIVWDVEYDFVCTTYFDIGRDMRASWNSMLDLVNEVIWTFREDLTLGGVVMLSNMDRGEPIIKLPVNPREAPKIIGHTFELMTKVQEENV